MNLMYLRGHKSYRSRGLPLTRNTSGYIKSKIAFLSHISKAVYYKSGEIGEKKAVCESVDSSPRARSRLALAIGI